MKLGCKTPHQGYQTLFLMQELTVNNLSMRDVTQQNTARVRLSTSTSANRDETPLVVEHGWVVGGRSHKMTLSRNATGPPPFQAGYRGFSSLIGKAGQPWMTLDLPRMQVWGVFLLADLLLGTSVFFSVRL